jgi:alkanesulfonate monooxygenase SsuD/methylene tetrahydromethanopterin reductase-like flavin-dependent oxidoreductase (luciferase family)
MPGSLAHHVRMTDDTNPASPDALSFAYWVPNVSGGLVTSDIEQRTHFDFDFNVRVAQLAERNGFDYALSQVRYAASYGADQQHESRSSPPCTRGSGTRACSRSGSSRPTTCRTAAPPSTSSRAG